MGHVPHAPGDPARLPSGSDPQLEVDMSIRARIFAATYDRFIAKTEAAGLAAHRAALLTGATGRTLEIGGGTGANFTHHGPARGRPPPPPAGPSRASPSPSPSPRCSSGGGGVPRRSRPPRSCSARLPRT